jgi:hypothetical protein
MPLPARLRKLGLTVHVTLAVGWLGTVIMFLALSIIGIASRDAATVRGAYLVMEPAARFVLLPLAFLSIVSGVVQGMGTRWGLSAGILLLYRDTFRQMADGAADPEATLASVRDPSPTLHSLLALFALGTATVLAVYKPWGQTRFRRRGQPAGSTE